jgi:hypothetical protein
MQRTYLYKFYSFHYADADALLIKLYWYLRINGFIYHQQNLTQVCITAHKIGLEVRQVFATYVSTFLIR